MNPTLKPSVSPLQLRDELETMVLKELLGPSSAEEERTVSQERAKALIRASFGATFSMYPAAPKFDVSPPGEGKGTQTADTHSTPFEVYE